MVFGKAPTIQQVSEKLHLDEARGSHPILDLALRQGERVANLLDEIKAQGSEYAVYRQRLHPILRELTIDASFSEEWAPNMSLEDARRAILTSGLGFKEVESGTRTPKVSWGENVEYAVFEINEKKIGAATKARIELEETPDKTSVASIEIDTTNGSEMANHARSWHVRQTLEKVLLG